MRWIPVWRLVLAAVLVLGLGACGGGGGGAGEERSVPFEPGAPSVTADGGRDLSMVELASDSVSALGIVQVLGWPEDTTLEGVRVEYFPLEVNSITPMGVDPMDDGWPGVMPLLPIDDALYLPVPLIDANGSDIVLIVTDGESRSTAMTLSIGPLPDPEAGVLEDLLDAYEDVLRASTEALGRAYPDEWEFWRDQGFNRMPLYLVPLARTWLIALDETNESALVNHVQEPESRELLERIFAGTGLADALRARAAMIEAGDTALTHAADLDFVRNNTVELLPQALTVSTAQGVVRLLQDNRVRAVGLPPIPDAGTLADFLHLYNTYRRVEQDAELFDATVGAYLRAIILVGSLPSGVGLTAAGTQATVLSASRRTALGWVTSFVTGAGTLSEVGQWFLPCCIPDMRVELNPAGGLIPHEDALEPQVRLAQARADAESAGVDITREAFDRLIRQFVSKFIDGQAKDALGGIVEIRAWGVIPGLGSYTQWDRKLDGRIARAMMSTQAVKGVEIGIGFRGAGRPGSAFHDEIVPGDPNVAGAPEGLRYRHLSNNAGGTEGGMSTGEELVVRIAKKPIATLMKPLRTVNMETGEPADAIRERSDTCAVPALGIIAEATLAIVLAEAYIERFGGDSVDEMKRNFEGYRTAISAR